VFVFGSLSDPIHDGFGECFLSGNVIVKYRYDGTPTIEMRATILICLRLSLRSERRYIPTTIVRMRANTRGVAIKSAIPMKALNKMGIVDKY
tara:strand:- start:256 stop:531 length:276 start_codon:yes stop_codon:yes gene_type:complete